MGSFESKPEDTLSEKDRIKLYKKEIAKAIRSLERETHKMEQMEAKLKATVLQKGKESGKSAELRIFVKDYLRTKKAITRFYTMRSSLMGVQTTIEMTASTLALKEGLKNASRALRDMRTSVNMGEMKGILKDFGEGVGEAEALQEEMDEAIGMAMDEPNQAEEEDKMIDDVFSQLRLEEQAKQAGRAGPALVGQAQAGMLAGPMMAVPLGGGAQPPPALPCLKCGQYGHSPLNCPGGAPPGAGGFGGAPAGFGAPAGIGAPGGGASAPAPGGGFGAPAGFGGGGGAPGAPGGFHPPPPAAGGGGGGGVSDLQARLNAISGKPPP